MKLPLQIGTSTDPFQPAETKYKNTYKILKLLEEYEYPFILITKGLIPESYFDLFPNDRSVIHYTLISTNDYMLKRLEPGAPSLNKRIENIKHIINMDLNLNLRIWPIIPSITDPENVIRLAATLGVSHIVSSFIRILKYPSFLTKLNTSLGFDYLHHLKTKGLCVTNELDQYMICLNERNKQHNELRALTHRLSMNYYTPNQPNTCDSCCGVDDIFGNVGPWSVKKRFNMIEGKSFDEYIQGTGCPFPEWFQRYWDQGKLTEFMQDLTFNDTEKKYYFKEDKQELLL